MTPYNNKSILDFYLLKLNKAFHIGFLGSALSKDVGSLRLRQDLEDYEKVLSGWDLYIQGLRRELMLRAPKTASTVRKIRADVRLR